MYRQRSLNMVSLNFIVKLLRKLSCADMNCAILVKKMQSVLTDGIKRKLVVREVYIRQIHNEYWISVNGYYY